MAATGAGHLAAGHGRRHARVTATTRRDIAILFAAALVLRGVAALLVPWAPYLDASYYTAVAQNLASGNGFSVPVIWAYLEVGSQIPPDASLPIPSNAHWPPLGPLVAAGGMVLFGTSWTAGQVPMVLVAATLPPLTYLVATELFASRGVAIGAGLLALFAGPLFILYPTIDNFALFGVAGTAVLYASMRPSNPPIPARGSWLRAWPPLSPRSLASTECCSLSRPPRRGSSVVGGRRGGLSVADHPGLGDSRVQRPSSWSWLRGFSETCPSSVRRCHPPEATRCGSRATTSSSRSAPR